MPARPKDVDWEAIEADFRAGVISVNQIAKNVGLSEGAIRQRARKQGWVRQEPVRVRQIAQQKADDAGLPRVPVDPEERIKELGSVAGDIIISHRKQFALMRSITQGLAGELLAASQNRDEVEESIIEFYSAKMEMAPTAAAALRQRMNNALAAVSLGARSKTALNLSSSIKIVAELERNNYKLDEQTGDKTYEQLLAEIHAKVLQPQQ